MSPAPGAQHLVDASLYVFRAWHGTPADVADEEGWPVNAVHGFARFLCDLLARSRARHLALAFDEALDSCFRNTVYPAYKANREPAPEELKRQFTHCKALGEALGLPVLAHGHYEADDLIGSAAEWARRAGRSVVIVSADKDMAQLLDEGDWQWDFARNERWDCAGVKPRFGIHAHQVPDYLGLTGDAIDNIPGVPGIGPKTAATLLGLYGSLDALLERLDEVPLLKLRGAAGHAARLHEHRETALLSRRLATIVRDAPLPQGFDGARRDPDREALDQLCERLRIGPMTRRRLIECATLWA
ncbi:MAG: exodeoxyribonuclease IX [Silanimonas sp.]|nr:MAG: exodeoxyribonuclease IX [Silanimonas sp.]GIX40102.1 MAG: exodeoxyribonuclease IX [Silanimonas sp.]